MAISAGNSESWQDVFLGLGSNLDDPEQQIKKAILALQKLDNCHWVKVSCLYCTAPMLLPGGTNKTIQADYINAVAWLKTELDPFVLLEQTMKIEQQHGRNRTGERWGARTLDIDLLLYGQRQINTEVLTIPHPGMHERNFVLQPLAELVPAEFKIPGVGVLSSLLLSSGDDGIRRLGN